MCGLCAVLQKNKDLRKKTGNLEVPKHDLHDLMSSINSDVLTDPVVMIEVGKGHANIHDTSSTTSSSSATSSLSSSPSSSENEAAATEPRRLAKKSVKQETTRRVRNSDGARREAKMMEKLDDIQQKNQESDIELNKILSETISKVHGALDGGMRKELDEMKKRQDKLQEDMSDIKNMLSMLVKKRKQSHEQEED